MLLAHDASIIEASPPAEYARPAARLEELVTLPPEAQDLPFGRVLGRIMAATPPAHATWPSENH